MRPLLCVLLLIVATPTIADECDVLVAQLVRQVQGLQLVERKHPDFTGDIVELRHPSAQYVSVFCAEPGVPYARLNVDHTKGIPGPDYFALVGAMGAVVTASSPSGIRDGAVACQRQALTSNEDLGDLEKDGVTFECQAFTRDGGSTTMTLSRHTN